MKTCVSIVAGPHRSRRGSAVFAVMMILSVICVLIVAQAQTTYFASREVRLIEGRQIKRLQSVVIDTSSERSAKSGAARKN